MYKFSKSCENVSFPGSSNAYGAKIVRLSLCKETQTISLAGKKLLPVEGVNKLGSFITFELSDRFNTKSDQPKNAFDVLVNTAVTLKYPKKIG
jgi:hypothetical protein